MIHSSPSVAHSVVEDQVFWNVSGDFLEVLNSHEQRMPSHQPFLAQTPREGTTLVIATIDLMVASIEESVKGALEVGAKLPAASLLAIEKGVVVDKRIGEGGLRASDEGKERSILLKEQPQATGGPSHSSATSSVEEVVDKVMSAGTIVWPSPADSLVEVIPLSTHLEAEGFRAEALERVAKSMRGFFSLVLLFSLTYLFPSFLSLPF